MNTDKAYILGLIIGGGIFGNAEDAFRISLPYRQWGSYEQNPNRAALITRDIMSVVSPMFRNSYGIIVSFEATNSEWTILCEGDLIALKADLARYGIKPEGELRLNSSLGVIIDNLADDNLKRRFIAGLADTIGSTARSHRRFSNEVQILSFEIKGFDFSFVCELCRLLHSINCFPDQILWNHPNFHCASNPYYTQWNKGFKLRVQLDQYAKFGAFAFRTKAESSQENRCLQQTTHAAAPCFERPLNATASCVHPAEHDKRLPTSIRGGHYLHNRHVCAVLGCEHAPYSKIKELFNRCGELVMPFPILCKGEIGKIDSIIMNEDILANRKYDIFNISIKQLLQKHQSDPRLLMYGSGRNDGYPIADVLHAIAYVIVSEAELNGTRLKGPFMDALKKHIESNPDLTVEFRRPNLLTPLVVCANERAVLVGARNPLVYRKLVAVSKNNKYKLYIRQITEEDLSHA